LFQAIARKQPHAPVAAVELEDELPEEPESILAPPEEESPGAGDAELKLASSRCDLHPLYPLRSARPDFSSRGAQASPPEPNALRCTHISCDRHYLADSGYFRLSADGSRDLGDVDAKPQCARNHEPKFMLVTKLPAGFFWSCPEPGCVKVLPYEEPHNGAA
jgi:hypothetical protein